MSLRLDGRNPLAYMGVNPNQPPQLIVNKRQPTTTDSQNVTLGTLWLIPEQDAPLSSLELWTLLSLTGNVATWVQIYPGSGGGGGTTSFITDSGTANEVGGDITIHGGSNIGTTGSGSTVTVNLDNTVSISGAMTAGTGVTATTGNIVATAGQVNAGTSVSAATTVTAGTGVQVTTGDVGLLAGNVTLPSTNSAGTEGEIKINGTRFISNYNNTTAVGNNSGNLTSTGLFGAAFGNSVLTSLTSGASNSGFGNGALQDCTSGGNNSCFGYVCGENITTGSGNTSMGDGSVSTLTTGGHNCSYGVSSLSQLVSGSNNIAIGGNGAGTAYTTSESNNIVIGNTGIGSESNAIHIGTQGSGAGQQNKAYMAGIYQASVGGTNEYVIVDSNGKLGSTPLVPGTGGSFSFIEKQTATADATLDFVTGITTDFNNYYVILNEINPSVANKSFIVQISTDGGSTWQTTNYINSSTATTIGLELAGTDGALVPSITSFTSLTSTLHNLTSGIGYIQSTTALQAGIFDPITVAVSNTGGNGAYRTLNQVVNGLRFKYTDGSVFNGEIELYGYSATPVIPTALEGLVFLSAQTTASATSLDFTTGITSTYKDYLMIVKNLKPTVAGKNFNVQLSVDGGSNWIATGYLNNAGGSTNGITIVRQNSGTIPTTNSYSDGSAILMNVTTGTGYVGMSQSSSSIFDPNAMTVMGANEEGFYTTPSTAVNALRFEYDDGSAFAGTVKLYGYVD